MLVMIIEEIEYQKQKFTNVHLTVELLNLCKTDKCDRILYQNQNEFCYLCQ